MIDDRVLTRIAQAIEVLDLAIPQSLFQSDFLRAVNTALGQIGGHRVESMDDEAGLARAVRTLEGAG